MKQIDLNEPVTERCNSSMQLTRAADYAVRVMVHLATLPEKKRAFLPDLAQAVGTNPAIVRGILRVFSPRCCKASRAPA